jgi:TolB-like protein
MGRDEGGTLARLLEHRKEHLEPALARYGGRLVKLTGDGVLVEFASAVDALSAAIEIQQASEDEKRHQSEDAAIVLRIGLHVGDLIVKGDDLYGDGVNVAARLEAEAPAGGIVISRSARDAVSGRVKATFEDLGSLSLKNIDRPLRAFSVKWQAEDWKIAEAAARAAAPAATPLTLPDRPSVAVLPFQNMSGDAEQEYFADGMVEDIITALSRFKSLFVIARNSSFTYKGKAVDIKQVGRELGVRYVLGGSVRKAAGRLRITGQLIDVETQTNIWADQFDGSLEDVFALQDQVATGVVARIAPRVGRAEIERARRQPVKDPDAYDFYLRALAAAAEGTREAFQETLRLCTLAMTRDPAFAAPYGLAAVCYATRRSNMWIEDAKAESVEARRLVSHVSRIAGDDALALARAGWSLAIVCDEVEAAAALLDEALSYNPNLAIAWTNRGFVNVFLGHHEAALEQFQRARRLSPIGKATNRADVMTACAYFCMGDNGEALNWATRVLHKDPNMPVAWGVAAVANALAGDVDEARRQMTRMRELAPWANTTRVGGFFHLRRPEDLKRMIDAMRLAGLPD